MADEQLVEVLRDMTRAENELTREQCRSAVNGIRDELQRDLEDLRAENKLDHAAVVERLEKGDERFESIESVLTGLLGKFDIPRRALLKAVAYIGSSGVLGVLAVKAAQSILGG